MIRNNINLFSFLQSYNHRGELFITIGLCFLVIMLMLMLMLMQYADVDDDVNVDVDVDIVVKVC